MPANTTASTTTTTTITRTTPTTTISKFSFNAEVFKPTLNWNNWIRRLEGDFRLFRVEPNDYTAALLHYIGHEAFEFICNKHGEKNPYDEDFESLKSLLQDFYAPRPLEIAENYRFYQRNQQEGESLQEYVVALQKLATNCKFGDYLKTALRNKFVFGVKNQRIQCRLLETDKLTFDEAIKIAVSMEFSERDASEFKLGNTSTEINLVNIRNKKKNTSGSSHGKTSDKGSTKPNMSNSNNKDFTNRNAKCYRCGGNDHRAPDCRLAKNIKCSFCGVAGHIQKACFKKNPGFRPRKGPQAHLIDEQEEMVEEINQLEHLEFRDKYIIPLMVNRKVVRFELDTGSAVTVMSEGQFIKSFPNAKIEPTYTKLISFCNTKLPILGVSTVEVVYKKKKHQLNIYISKVDKMPLLGREWSRQLGILKVDFVDNSNHAGFNEIHSNARINDISTDLTTVNQGVHELLNKYKNLGTPGLSKITGIQGKLTLKPNSRPVYVKARPLPFKLKSLVEKELDLLVKEGILIKVNTSDWATPIVPVLKNNNTVRICGDFKITLNPQLEIDDHPLPTTDELFATMAGGKKFSKIDLKQAYLQLEIRPEDRHLLTINTHRGLFQCTRLLYGVASAPAIWQREMENILADIEGVSVFLDDIRVTGPTDELHLQRLEQVLKQLQKYNIKINTEKCEFFKDEINYCGYKIDAEGIHKTKSKTDAIDKMRRPNDKSELRSFLGMVNYYAKFIKNLSSILYPLNQLLQNDVPFVWTEKCERSFQSAKKEFKSETILTHYDPKLPLIVASDASKYGVGAVLSQKQQDGSEKVIQYASQTLNKTQQRYSQIDKEAYSIIFAIKKFHQYLYGNRFTLYTDHQPLVRIFAPDKSLPLYSAMRMQHYAIFLQGFNYEIKYKNTKMHGNADCLSRLPINQARDSEFDVIDVFQIQTIETLPLNIKDIQEETVSDEKLKNLLHKLTNGVALEKHERFGLDTEEFNTQQGVLFRGHRVIIPKTLQKRILQELHEGHSGIVKTKALARSYCWWQNIDKDIETMIKNCEPCQIVLNEPNKCETHIWEIPSTPFDRIHFDFAGPFKNKYFAILVDAYSKFPIVKILRDITTKSTIRFCREIFATYGIPRVFVSDNGSQLTSQDFINFLNNNGIIHKRTAPFHPATNGLAERFVQTLKKALISALEESNDIEINLQRFLLKYRVTPHCTTQISPAELVFNRKLRTKLDLIIPRKIDNNSNVNETKQSRQLAIGDKVQVRNYSSKLKWEKGEIIDKIGKLHYIIKLDDNRVWKRHIDQIIQIAGKTSNSRILRGNNVNVKLTPEIASRPPEAVTPVVFGARQNETIPISETNVFIPATPHRTKTAKKSKGPQPGIDDPTRNLSNAPGTSEDFTQTPKPERSVRQNRGTLPKRFLEFDMDQDNPRQRRE